MKKEIAFRILLSLGIILATFPLLFGEYIHLPDFVRGGIEGFGIGLEIIALVLQKRLKKGCSSHAEYPVR